MGSAKMTERQQQNANRLYAMPFAKLYPSLLAKVEGKGHTRAELDRIVCWLTGYSAEGFAQALEDGRSTRDFIARAPHMNPNRTLITGTICGVRLHEIEDPLMLELRYLDKLVDELAKGRPMEKILRG